MYELQNISSEPAQQHTLLLDNGEAVLNLRFLPAVQVWLLSVMYEDKKRTGIKLSANVYHLRQYNFPFDFTVLVNDQSGVDPFKVDDFSTGRCSLFFITPESMRKVRGQEK